MTYVVTLRDFLPPARYDSVAWATARIQEAAASTGSWSTIATVSLSPTDSDPANPALRNLTTSAATIASGGWYRVTFIDGSSNESSPSDPVQNADVVTSTSYVSASALKSTLSLSGYSFADDDIDLAIVAASRSIDKLANRRFYLDADATSVRYFTPDRTGELDIDDLAVLTSLATDDDGSFTYATALTSGVDFVLDPPNAAADVEPYTRVLLTSTTGASLNPGLPRSVKLTGQFGWPAVPADIKQATTFLAGRLLRQAREAPFGVVTYGESAIRMARSDPTVRALVGPYSRHLIAVA